MREDDNPPYRRAALASRGSNENFAEYSKPAPSEADGEEDVKVHTGQESLSLTDAARCTRPQQCLLNQSRPVPSHVLTPFFPDAGLVSMNEAANSLLVVSKRARQWI